MDDRSDLVAFPQQPSDRLRLALRRLESALSEQAEAVADFRRAMTDLREVMDGLASSVDGYRLVLDRTQQECQVAHGAAVGAGATADALLARLH